MCCSQVTIVISCLIQLVLNSPVVTHIVKDVLFTGYLPTLSIPILSIPIWSMLTKRELTKWELMKWEVDKVGTDEVHFRKI